MRVSFHEEADQEFFEAIEYYEGCEKGLGEDFSFEVYSVIHHVIEHPEAWPIIENGVRRCFTKRFPYGVLYSLDNNEIFILAMMHLHRSPDYWKSRM